MYYPQLTPENVTRDFIDVFGGYDHNYRINENEFYDMQNMSSDCYPLLASRKPRGLLPQGFKLAENEYIRGMLYRSNLFYATYYIAEDNKTFLRVYKDHELIGEFPSQSGQVANRTLLLMGAYLIIRPEKVYVNITDTTDCGYIDAELNINAAADKPLTVQPCSADGTVITADYIGAAAPSVLADGKIWLDISEDPPIYKKYYASQSSWFSLTTDCVLLSAAQLDDCPFEEGDGIRLTGFTDNKLKKLNGFTIVRKLIKGDNDKITSIAVTAATMDLNDFSKLEVINSYPVRSTAYSGALGTSTVEIYYSEEMAENAFQNQSFADYTGAQHLCNSSSATYQNPDSNSAEYPYCAKLTLTGAVSIKKNDKNIYNIKDYNNILAVTEGTVALSRKMPSMDYVIECKNRLWGCRYGKQDGETVNEIYASKLGDFKNWRCYEGVSTDSYTASCGSDGEWTGAINYMGYPVFFKANHIHTVYGSLPSQYQINDIAARGIQQGSGYSLVMINETLFYLSDNGVCAYNGSVPSEISSALGNEKYHGGRACAYKGKYYLSVLDSADNSVLFVYDTNKGLWHKEDDMRPNLMCAVQDDVYYVDRNYVSSDKEQLRSLFAFDGDRDPDPVEWYMETGMYGLSDPDKKYVSRLNIRLSLETGAYMTVSIEYNNSGIWERLCTVERPDINPFTLPIKPRRCDRFRLRLEGEGGTKIYSVSKTTEQGSDK